jgi:hypothetical protein
LYRKTRQSRTFLCSGCRVFYMMEVSETSCSEVGGIMVKNKQETRGVDSKHEAAGRHSFVKAMTADMLHGSKDGPVDLPQIVAGMMGMAGPIALGIAGGHAGLGLLASFGAMVVSGASSGGTIRQRAVEMTCTMLVGTAAVFAGSLMGGRGWLTGVCIVLMSAAAALLGGMGRSAAQAGTQFMLLAIIGASMGDGGLRQHPYALACLFAAGSLWGMVVSLIAASLLPSSGRRPDAAPAAAISHTERLRRWRRSLAHVSSWQYTLRVALCMTAAEAVGMFLHHERSYWISLTVALVLQRNFASALTRTVQRGIGTAAGVLLSGLLLLGPLPNMGMVLLVAVLAALRPIFKHRSYALYAALMTPLLVVIFSLGGPVTGSLLFERFLDTMIGCIISLVLGYAAWPNRNALSRKV